MLILALVVRGLVPAGYMLVPSAAGGTLSVVICTGHGPETIAFDADGKPVKPKPANSDSGLCPYAASAPVALAVATLIAVETPPTFAVVAYSNWADRVLGERRGGSASARGPPSPA